MIDGIRMSGLEMADNMVYVRAMQALALSDTQRMAILAGMSQSPNPYCPKALKEMSTRLLSTPTKASDVLIQERVDQADEVTEEPHDTYMAMNKSKNRQGVEKAAIVGTQKKTNEFPEYSAERKRASIHHERKRERKKGEREMSEMRKC